MAIITIVGAGMMGSALAFPALENGHEVRLVGTPLDSKIIDECFKSGRHLKHSRAFEGNISYYKIDRLKEALNGSHLLIGGISSFGVDWFLNEVLASLDKDIPILTVTKGLINDNNLRLISYPDYWEQELKKKGKNLSINAVAGPCTSYELVARDKTVVTFCGKDLSTLTKIKSLLQTDYYYINLSTDVIGTESAAALKNAYTLAVAITIGQNEIKKDYDNKEHFNSQAAVFGQSVKEMRRLISFLGGKDDSLDLGVGDLYVTVFGGRTRLLGRLLGQGLLLDEALLRLEGMTLESVVVTKRVADFIAWQSNLGKIDYEKFPLLKSIYAAIGKKQLATIPYERFN